MQTITIEENDTNSARFDFFPARNNFKRAVVLIDGSGGNRLKLRPLSEKLSKSLKDRNIVAISFKGTETGVTYPPETQFDDLRDILNHLIKNNGIEKFDLVCTSMGAVSTVLVLGYESFNNYLDNVIMFDPADYLTDLGMEEGRTWKGYEKYDYKINTLSKLMNKITSNVKVYVVNFKIRNYSPQGYAPESERGTDNPKLFSRLNNEMVRAFYNRTPKKNQGKYLQDKKLPHAFLRDGNIEKNVELVSSYVVNLLEI